MGSGGSVGSFGALRSGGSLKDFSLVTAAVLRALCVGSTEPHCPLAPSGPTGLICICHQKCAQQRVEVARTPSRWNQMKLRTLIISDLQKWQSQGQPESLWHPLLSFRVPLKDPGCRLWKPFSPCSPAGHPCPASPVAILQLLHLLPEDLNGRVGRPGSPGPLH